MSVSYRVAETAKIVRIIHDQTLLQARIGRYYVISPELLVNLA